jgi:hypothetical protein
MARALLRPYKPPRRYIPKKSSREESVHRAICRYLRSQYPRSIFRTDFTAGRIPLTPNQGRQYAALQSGRAFPDLFIYEPRIVSGRQYAGLALELKREGTSIFLKRGERKGELVADLHIQEQYHMLEALKKRGYWAEFAVGTDQAIAIIDKYMGKPLNAELPF